VKFKDIQLWMTVALFGTCAFIFFRFVDRFWDRGLIHIAFGDRIVGHCHRLCRSTVSIVAVILDAMRSVRINRRYSDSL
jgi:hypothetical protein